MTLFGMNEKKKRGIIVPVMALAVCAVAMVGLGFAITSTVTTSNNEAADLMIDVSQYYSYFAAGGDGEKSPSTGPVDGILSVRSYNEKIETNPGIKTEGGYAFIKVYGNVDKSNYKLKVETSSDMQGAVLSLFFLTFGEDQTTVEGISPAYATATIDPNGKGVFTDVSPECGETYVVALTKIDDCVFKYTFSSYNESSKNITLTTAVESGTFDAKLNQSFKFIVTNETS